MLEVAWVTSYIQIEGAFVETTKNENLKKQYECPVLTVYGPIHVLTQTNPTGMGPLDTVVGNPGTRKTT
jgi:hypothetical protein